MSLGERITEQRKNSGLSQEKVAEFVGVSRQAVTKWEANQSAPSTENLFKLAEIFGTTVDMLLSSNDEGKNSPAEQIYYLYKMEEEKKAVERRGKIKKNLLLTLAVIGGYIIIYLSGRIFGTTGTQASIMGWLFGNDPEQLSYLYGWLLKQNIFWGLWQYQQSLHCLGKGIFLLLLFWDLRLLYFLVNFAGIIQQGRHTDMVITVGLFGAVSLRSLL